VRELRAGIVGTGFVGKIHARSIRVAGARLAGVASSSPESAAAACRELGAERSYADAEELIASDAIDVVHICTPNKLHELLAVAAAQAGKHVVCEKPVALDSAGADRILSATAAAGVVATVPFVYRFYPTVRECRARLHSGATGQVRVMHGGYLQDWLSAAEDYNWRVDPALGGASRAFADIGSHWCDLLEFVTGQRIARLVARTAIAHPERVPSSRAAFSRGGATGRGEPVETEDVAAVLFETDGGATGSMLVSQVSAGFKNKLWFEVTAESETIGFDQEHPDTLAIRTRTGTRQLPRDFDTLASAATPYVTLPGGHPQGYHDCFDLFVADTYAAIAGSPPADGLPGFVDGLRATEITEAVIDSARRGTWVEVA